MTQSVLETGGVRRRTLLAGAAAVASVAALGGGTATAATQARYRRYNVASPEGAKMLESYKKAITAMLALPPDDPRNWYRHALTHTVDCPHGNWWFVVWHRGYVGWFEQVCRDLSGDPDFAFPYWDWTANPQVPAAMFDGVLNPNDPAYIPSLAAFNAQYGPMLDKFWDGLTPAQTGQLLIRGLRFSADLLFDIGPKGGPMFFPQGSARGSTQAKPGFDDITNNAVSPWMLDNALAPRDFIGFASPKTFYHGSITGFGVLEGQPHNKVHNCTGGIWTDPNGQTTYGDGFMQSNLSPVDPLFFLHHSNIDRLWDVWTRKQQGYGYPTLPDNNPSALDPKGDLGRWQSEPFLFFSDAKGQVLPPQKQLAGYYATIGEFDYDYQPGSGEQVVPPAPPAAKKLKAVAAAPPQQFAGTLKVAGKTSLGAADVAVPTALLTQAAQPNGPRLFATITVELSPFEHGQDLAVLINTPEGQAFDAKSPGFVTTLSMFGNHVVQRPVTFMVPLSKPLAALNGQKLLRANQPLSIRVARLGSGGPKPAMLHSHGLAASGATTSTAQVTSIVIESH
jgi:tyrosinase